MLQISRKFLTSDAAGAIQHYILRFLIFEHLYDDGDGRFISIHVGQNRRSEMSHLMLVMVAKIYHHGIGFVQFFVIRKGIEMLPHIKNIKLAVVQAIRKHLVLDKNF